MQPFAVPTLVRAFSLYCCQAFGCSLWVLTWSRMHHEVGRFKPIYFPILLQYMSRCPL